MISIHILFHIFGAWKILFKSVKVWRFLNPFESVNIVEYIQTTTPGTVLNGPTCWRPVAALPRSPLFLQHPVADHWAMMPPGPTCQLHRTASPAPHRPEPSRHHGLATTLAPPLSLLLPPLRGMLRPTPPFPCLTPPPLQKAPAAALAPSLLPHLSLLLPLPHCTPGLTPPSFPTSSPSRLRQSELPPTAFLSRPRHLHLPW
jgi:hypothetical protein